MDTGVPALASDQFLRSVGASRSTLDKPEMKLLDMVAEVRALTGDAPYAVIGGLAQILWARKSHTDDLDIALATSDLTRALARVAKHEAEGWNEPTPPDVTHESDEVFQVGHLLCRGAVVDLISFRNEGFNTAIVTTARAVESLAGARFVRPELLLITQLLRPGPEAALAAIELVIARKKHGGIDVAEARHWAHEVGRAERLETVLRQADVMEGV